MRPTRRAFLAGTSCVSVGWLAALAGAAPEEKPSLPKAFIEGTEDGWKAMVEDDFAHVNCDEDTWAWKDGVIHCTGKPVGVIQSKTSYKNFELVVEWRHLRSAGNSGVFVWATAESLENLKKGKGRLPKGIECQVLDHGYAENSNRRARRWSSRTCASANCPDGGWCKQRNPAGQRWRHPIQEFGVLLWGTRARQRMYLRVRHTTNVARRAAPKTASRSASQRYAALG